MKSKFFLLSTIVTSCIFALGNQASADDRHPDMPSGGNRCYPGSKCTGDPNLIHNDGDHSEGPGHMHGKAPQMNKNGKPMKPLRMDSVEKIKATVKRVERVRLPNETQIQLIVETDRGEMHVIVGPARFVDQSMVKMQAGDKIEIYGYMVRANGDEVLMAAEIKKNGNSLKLLNDKRQPMWH